MKTVIFKTMSNNILEYKGYYTKIEYSAEDHVLFGRIEGIKDLVNFESDSIADVEKQFHAAVDDYLAFCQDIGQDPDKPYRGNFNVRISPELHRLAAMAADKKGQTLNAFVAEAIKDALSGKQTSIIVMPVPEKTLKNYVSSGSTHLRSQIRYGT